MIFKRFDSVIVWVGNIVSAFCLARTVMIAAGSVFGCYVLHTGFPWANEVNQMLLVVMGMFGNAGVVRSDGHVELTSFINSRRSRATRIVMRAAINTSATVLLVFMFVISMQFTSGGIMKSAVLRVPRVYFYVSIPTRFGLRIYKYLKMIKIEILADAVSEKEQEETQMGEIIVLLVILTFIFIIMGTPIYTNLMFTGLLSLVALTSSTAIPLVTLVIPQPIFNSIGSLPLSAISFFMLADEVMNRGKITKKLIRFAMLLTGCLPAGPSLSSTMASMFLDDITGFAQASTFCMGGILIPAMKEEGYPTKEAIGIITVTSTCEPIILSSIIMAVSTTTAGCSVGAIPMGGLISGILVSLVLMIILLVHNHMYHFPEHDGRLNRNETAKATPDGIIPLGIPVIIVEGIVEGVCTPTEAGAIAVVYSLLVSLFVSHTLRLRDIWSLPLATVDSAASLLLTIAYTQVFSYGLTALQTLAAVDDLISSLTSNKYVFLMFVNTLPLIMGMFMDGGAPAIILTLILASVAAALGISTIHFDVITAPNLTIGNITSPLGYCLFIGSRTGDITVGEGTEGIIPYLIAEIAALLLVIYIPSLVTYVPVMLGYNVV